MIPRLLAPAAPTGPAGRRRRRLLRRWCSAGLVAAAGAGAVTALAPPATPTTTVLVAARDLPAGSTPGAADLEAVQWPARYAPGGLLSPADLGEVRLSAALRRGEALTDTRTSGPGLLVGQPPGTLAAAVDVGDPTVLTGLHPGAHVDLLATTLDPVTGEAGTAQRIAVDVVVLSVPSQDPAALLGAGSGGAAGSILVAVDTTTASELGAAQGRTVVVVRAG